MTTDDAHEKFFAKAVRPVLGNCMREVALVVGSKVYEGRNDRRTLYRAAIGVDLEGGPGVDIVGDISDDLTRVSVRRLAGEGFTHVDCHSVLEHAPDPFKLAWAMEQMVVPGGTIFVSVPFVWRLHSYPNDLWRFTPQGFMSLFKRVRWTHLNQIVGTKLVGFHSQLEAMTPISDNPPPYFARTELVGFGVVT